MLYLSNAPLSLKKIIGLFALSAQKSGGPFFFLFFLNLDTEEIVPLEPELVMSTPTYDPFGTEKAYKKKLFLCQMGPVISKMDRTSSGSKGTKFSIIHACAFLGMQSHRIGLIMALEGVVFHYIKLKCLLGTVTCIFWHFLLLFLFNKCYIDNQKKTDPNFQYFGSVEKGQTSIFLLGLTAIFDNILLSHKISEIEASWFFCDF